MKVSVQILAYNHEAYISQAIDSALSQKTSFDYEIIVGEDASSDRTRKIVLEYKKEYPAKVRVILCDSDVAERDRAAGIGGKTNFLQSYPVGRGEYVALLDGDDYWTDVHKLQTQVEFLDTHPDFAVSCHRVTMIDQEGKPATTDWNPPGQKTELTVEDLFATNFIPTSSVIFRRDLFGAFPEWFRTLKMGDWPLHIMNAAHGKIAYRNGVMATYRVHERGSWSSASALTQGLEIVRMLDHLDGYFDFRYREQIRRAKAARYYELAQLSYGEGKSAEARAFLAKYVRLAGLKGGRAVLNLFFRLQTPTLYTRFARSKNPPPTATPNKLLN